MGLFALAGFAEGAIAATLGFMCLGVVLMAACALLGLLLRSRVAAVLGLGLFAGTAFLFLPWEAFTLTPSDDPDARSLDASYRGLAVWWVLTAAVVTVAAVRAFAGRRPASAGGA